MCGMQFSYPLAMAVGTVWDPLQDTRWKGLAELELICNLAFMVKVTIVLCIAVFVIEWYTH